MERLTKRIYELRPGEVFLLLGKRYYVKRVTGDHLEVNRHNSKHLAFHLGRSSQQLVEVTGELLKLRRHASL